MGEWVILAKGEGVDTGGPRVVVGGRDLAGVSESEVGVNGGSGG